MGYFAYIADRSFGTSAKGERLFYSGGPWSRPYVIPTDAAAQELRSKNLWLTRLSLWPIFLGLPALGILHPSSMRDPVFFIGLLTLGTLAVLVLKHVLLGPTLKQLPRLAEGSPYRDRFLSVAAKHSFLALAALMCVSLGFVAAGIWMFVSGFTPLISIFCIGLFALSSLARGYSLLLKIRQDWH